MRPRYSLVSAVHELKSGISPRYGREEEHRPPPALVQRPPPKPPPRRPLWGRARSNFGVGPTKTAAEWTSALKPTIVHYKAQDLSKEMEEVAASGMVITEQERDAKATAFWQQGDTSLNTYEVMRQRLKLRHSPPILAALLAWWETALRSDGIEDPEGRSPLGKEGHIRCLTMLFSGLIEGWDAASKSGKQELEESWEEDSKGSGLLRRDDFFDALFELADGESNGPVGCLLHQYNLWSPRPHTVRDCKGISTLKPLRTPFTMRHPNAIHDAARCRGVQRFAAASVIERD